MEANVICKPIFVNALIYTLDILANMIPPQHNPNKIKLMLN